MTLKNYTGIAAAAWVVCAIGFAQDAPIAPPPPQTPAPAPAKAKTIQRPKIDPENIESMASISYYRWQPKGHPGYRAGNFVTNKSLRTFDFPGDQEGFGALLTFPTGGFNRLEIGVTRTSASAQTRPGRQLSLAGANIPATTLLNVETKIQTVNVRWNYLTYPVPSLDSRLRIKSFWEVHYAKYTPLITYPEDIDSNGNNRGNSLKEDKSLFYPGVGVGFEFVPFKAFRIEGGGAGMALPGRSRYVDASLQAVIRVKRFEVFGGFKGYHFQTSPRKDELYIKGTLKGPMFGLRWVFD